jgi:Glycosyltransferase family 87
MYRGLTFTLLFLLVTGTVIGIVVPAGPGWDFANFYDTGRRIAAGQISDLYHPESAIAGQQQPEGRLGFYGTPISALLYFPLSFFSPAWAMIVFKIQNTLAYFAALVMLYLHNRKFVEASAADLWQFTAIFVALSLTYQPFWTIYRVGGQTTPTVFLLFVLALVLQVSARSLPAAACMVAAVLIKPAFIFALALLVCVSGWRFLKNTAVIFTVVGLVSVLTLGWAVHQEFFRMMLAGSQESRPWFYNSSMYVTADNLKLFASGTTNSSVLTLSIVAVKALALAVCVFALIQSRSFGLPDGARRHFDFLTSIVFSLLVMQIVWEHYLTALFPLLAYIAASRRHFSHTALALAIAIFLGAAWQNLILVNFLRTHFNFNSVPELLFIGVLKSAPLLLTMIFLWRYYQDVFRSYSSSAWSH